MLSSHHVARVWISVLVATAIIAGCAGPPEAPRRTVAYHSGVLSTIIDAPAARVVAASERIVKTMQLNQSFTRAGDPDTTIYGYTADDQRVEIIARRRSDSTTGLHIRVGEYGDRDRAWQLLDAITRELR